LITFRGEERKITIESFSKVAPYLTNPLVLIGFSLLVLSGVLKALLKAGVLTPVTPTSSSRVVTRLLYGLFFIALLLIVLGFGLAAWNSFLAAKEVRRKGFMQVAQVWFVNKSFTAGERLGVNVSVKNMGDEPVQNMYHFIKVGLLEPTKEPEADWEYHTLGLKDALRGHAQAINGGYKGVRVGVGDSVWTTTMIPDNSLPPLTELQVDHFMQGRSRIYVYVWARWRDSQDDVDFCEWLQTPSTNEFNTDKLIWHLCAPH
jgi:hypothetical protein